MNIDDIPEERLHEIRYVDIPGVYETSKWGQEYHSLTCDEALGGGSAGPGKSLVLLMDPNAQVMVEMSRMRRGAIGKGRSKGWALHLRRESTMLDQTLARAEDLFHRIDPKVVYDKVKRTFIFESGYRYTFGHCKERDDWKQYLSNEYTYIGFDELWQFEQEQYQHIKARLRTSDPVLRKMLKVRGMTNPAPNWVRAYFVDPAPEGRVILTKTLKRRGGDPVVRSRIFLPATLYDNPDPEFVADYEAKLLDQPPHIRDAMLYGDWYVTAGAFYSEAWRKDLHIVRPFVTPGHWPAFRAMDWGFKTRGIVGWFRIDPDDNLIMTREFVFRKKMAREVAADIQDIEAADGHWDPRRRKSKLTGPADTQIWEEKGVNAVSIAEEHLRAGVPWVRANKKSRKENARRVYSRLVDHHDGTVRPGLSFFDNCYYVIRTLPAIQTDPDDSEEPAKGGEDHGHDMVCYGCAYRGPKGTDDIEDRRRQEMEEDRQYDDGEEAGSQRGRHGYGLF